MEATLDTIDLRTEIPRHRGDLLRIATIQLRDPHLADDVVQETMLAALSSAHRFKGRSNVKTWLIGIMKHKVVDALRARARAPRTLSELERAGGADADLDALFDDTGTWQVKPAEWADPTHTTRQRDFDRVLERCLERLPGLSAQAFVLREVFEVDAEEVCGIVSVTRNHLNVLLYRARMRLRRCLDIHWIGGEGALP